MLTLGNHIRLTSKEQSLLDYLTRTGVKPRTRAELERALDDAHKAWNAAAPACPEASLMAALTLDFKKAF